MTPPWVVPPRVEDAGNSDGTGPGTGGGGIREPRPPSPISALPAVLVESGPPTVVTAFTHAHVDGSSSSAAAQAAAAAAMDDRGTAACNGLRLVPSFVVSEDASSRRLSSTSLGRESSFTTTAAAAASSPGSPALDSSDHHAMMMNQHHSRGWGGGHIGDDPAALNAADRVVVLRDGLTPTTTTSRAMVGAKRSWGIDGGPSSDGVDSGGGRVSVRRHSVAATPTAAGGLLSSRKLQRLDRRYASNCCSAYYSGRKCKGRLVFIFVHQHSLHFRPEVL